MQLFWVKALKPRAATGPKMVVFLWLVCTKSLHMGSPLFSCSIYLSRTASISPDMVVYQTFYS